MIDYKTERSQLTYILFRCFSAFCRHQLATQKQICSNLNAATAPSPPAREHIPPSFESRDRTQTSSSSYSSLGSSASTIIVNGFASTASTGSDSNLNRSYPTNGSLRQQLLRRLWHKEYRRLDRTGSLSPPLHRSLRTKRPLRVQDIQPDVCLECQRLEADFNRSVPEIASHHSQHNTNTTAANTTTSKTSSFTFARKSYSIETETPNDTSMLAISSASSGSQSQQMHTIHSKSVSTSISNQTHDDYVNGNVSPQQMGNDSYLIEMDDDRINITTTALTESTGETASMLQASSEESTLLHPDQLTEATVSQLSNQWHELSNSDGNNNYNSHRSTENGTKITEIGRMHGGVYDAYHMSSGEIDLENESVVRLKTHEPLDQSTIDTIISQILVDSLNNIIVVQGKGQQSELNGNQVVGHSTIETQTDQPNASRDDSASNTTSSLPLPVTDQIYFPHYLSTETLSGYSTKLSDNSSAVDLLPSNLVISVISGSSYPGDGGEMVVHRMSDGMHRTESMEVQPSSAASIHDDNGNVIVESQSEQNATNAVNQQDTENNNDIENKNDDDDDISSLVDSLDDPNAIENVSELDNMPTSASKLLEKGEAFFISIDNVQPHMPIIQSPLQSTDEFGANAPLANTMPERLRERLEKRQLQISERKDAVERRRQEKLMKLIGQHVNSKSSSTSFEVIPDDSPTSVSKESATASSNHSKVLNRKIKRKQLKSDIGSLESYTVDAQGNLKFVETIATKKSHNATKKVTTISGPVVKHVAIKKTITAKKPLITAKKSRDTNALEKMPPNEKRTKAAVNVTKHRIKEANSMAKVSKDVQKMTLGQHSPSDLITPDRDCGPRRMYQKTEIREGAKRIEILEIVEC